MLRVEGLARRGEFQDVGFEGFVAMMIFLLILIVGFAYEWKKGALEWE